MRAQFQLLMLFASACATYPDPPTVADDVPGSLIPEMRRLGQVDCPVPPTGPKAVAIFLSDTAWYEGWFGTVVGADRSVLAVRMRGSSDWSSAVQHLVLSVSRGQLDSGFKGNAVVVGTIADLLICRFFPDPLQSCDEPALGDEVVLQHAMSRYMQDSRHDGIR